MLRTALGTLTHLLWPARCASCHSYVPAETAFCAGCSPSVTTLGRACSGCALPLGSSEPTCAACARDPGLFRRAYAALVYEGAVVDALLRFKHGKHREIARPLGRILAPLMQEVTRDGVDVLMPVPLHARRLRSRGFNQSLDLIWAARDDLRAHHTRRPFPPVWIDILRRVRDTPPLGSASPVARRSHLEGAFAVDGRARGLSFLLVDDVMTTGATLRACAHTLLDAGATSVATLALCRAL